MSCNLCGCGRGKEAGIACRVKESKDLEGLEPSFPAQQSQNEHNASST
jgi:hypothetical protein